MSRSNPSQDSPHPCTRWFEWAGGKEGGHVTYYDKTKPNPDREGKLGLKVNVKLPFPFILLDELSVIKGWHEPSESGITSNEVKDTRDSILVVKSFKGGPIANGLYSDIKDKVTAAGGYFTSNLYIAYWDGKAFSLGSIMFAGAALSAWMDFKKKHRTELIEKGVRITGFDTGKKGSVVYRFPKFELVDLKPEHNAAAVELDKGLQVYLKSYFERTGTDQAKLTGKHDSAVQADAPSDVDQEPTSRSSGGFSGDPGFDQSAADDEDGSVPF